MCSTPPKFSPIKINIQKYDIDDYNYDNYLNANVTPIKFIKSKRSDIPIYNNVIQLHTPPIKRCSIKRKIDFDDDSYDNDSDYGDYSDYGDELDHWGDNDGFNCDIFVHDNFNEYFIRIIINYCFNLDEWDSYYSFN